MNVLSLFDGMSCGRLALERAGIDVGSFFASEIDPMAIKVAMKNYPDTIQIGDVTKVSGKDLPTIDLLIGGSPCQSLSNAGDGSGFDGKSGLFFEWTRLLEECRPKWFLLENVRMKKEWQDVITRILGTEPVLIDSCLVSAQNRKRLYWTNIPISGMPEDRKIFIEDILESGFDQKYWLPEKNAALLSAKVDITGAPDVCCIDVYNRRYKKDRKCPTLTHPCHNSIRLLQGGRFRKLTPVECERLQTVPDGYTEGVSDTHRYAMLGNGWTVDVIAHIFKGLA
jgi:DNA (cytosine-5)-methyltransferase 3A